jgi:pimeloyl-ACP methyl ester carboxylesterase
VIRPDHPGFIESDSLADESIAGIAAFYSRFFDALQLDDVLVIGASMGGWIATELALLEPRRVTRLIVVDPAGMMVPGVPVGNVFELSAEEVAERMFAPGPQRDAAVAKARVTLGPDDVSFLRSERSKATARKIASQPLMDDPSLPARAGAIAMPVTLVWGEHDRLVPPEHAEAWLAAIPGSRLVVIANAGHGPQVQQPEAFLVATGLATSD